MCYWKMKTLLYNRQKWIWEIPARMVLKLHDQAKEEDVDGDPEIATHFTDADFQNFHFEMMWTQRKIMIQTG